MLSILMIYKPNAM